MDAKQLDVFLPLDDLAMDVVETLVKDMIDKELQPGVVKEFYITMARPTTPNIG